MKTYYRVSLYVALFVVAAFAASFNAQGPSSTDEASTKANVAISNLAPLTLIPTAVTVPASCTFVWPAAAPVVRK